MFCRGVGTDTEVSEEEVYMADEWPKRILFLTVPLRGHVTHTARLAEWFLRKPEKYQIHVGVPSEGAGLLPKGVTTHEPQDGEPNPGAEEVDKPFVLAAHAKNWEDSMAAMIVNADLDYITGLTLFGIRVLREVQPHVVVCDHTYAGANYLHTACRSEEVPLIVITSMGRPESMNNMASILKIIPPLLGRTSAALGLIGPLINLQSSLKGEVGSTLPESDQPNIILPSCRLFFEEEPPDHLLFTGPFLPLPTKGKDTTALADSPDLLQWLRSAIDPVVFVALGTLVQPSQELLGRLVEGLESDRWRVLWALPESHQLLLPQRSFSSRWRIDKFVPQLAVLSSGYISCFISHCGANSTLESMSNGVPMVCMPFFCDQYEWADTVCELKQAGVWIDKNDADAEEIHGALEAVLDDPTYKRNAEIVAEEMLEEAQAKLRLAGLQSGAGPLTADKRSGAGVPVAAMVIEATLKGEDPRMLFKAPPTAPVRRLKKQGCC